MKTGKVDLVIVLEIATGFLINVRTSSQNETEFYFKMLKIIIKKETVAQKIWIDVGIFTLDHLLNDKFLSFL